MTKRREPPFLDATCPGCGATFPKYGKRTFCTVRCREKNLDFAKRREKYAADAAYREKIREYRRRYVEQFPDKARESDAKCRARPSSRVRAATASREWHASHKDDANQRRIVRKQMQRVKRPWSVMLGGARKRAKDAGIPFDLTDEWGSSRWTGKCELSGMPFRIIRGMGTKIFAPSLDRIVPALGYVQGNCRFILFCLNAFKHNGTDEEMYAVAEALINRRSELRGAEHQRPTEEAA